jgi:small subunit ribosomal protein S9
VSSSNATTSEPKTQLSLAMKFYLEKKREHDAFIAHERSEFEMGKKHLANMMGMEAEAMTQESIS